MHDEVVAQKATTSDELKELTTPEPRWRSYGCIVVAILGVGLSLVIGFQLIRIAYAILSPPDAPLPAGVNEISHQSIAYGVDEWVYGTDQDGCEIIAFFLENDGVCRIPPGTCVSDGFVPQSNSFQNVGNCNGSEEFSIFLMRWRVTVTTGYLSGDHTRFNLRREVIWTGNPPIATSTPPPN